MENKIKDIIITKNRGWRGLAEVRLYDKDDKNIGSRVFTFSPDTWNDLINDNIIVIEEEIDGTDMFTILHFDVAVSYHLPKPTQQRSVLIKNVICYVTSTVSYPAKYSHNWLEFARYGKDILSRHPASVNTDYIYCEHYGKNNNYYTQSVYNQVGIKVTASLF